MKEHMKDFNFIITTYRNHEKDVIEEAYVLFPKMNLDVDLSLTDVRGLIIGRCGGDPRDVSRRLTAMVRDDPWTVRKILRFIPIDRSCGANEDEITDNVKQLVTQIEGQETFRITIEKRHSTLESKRLIGLVGGLLRNRVDLESPDKVVLIEVMADRAGVAMIRPADIFSLLKAKLD